MASDKAQVVFMVDTSLPRNANRSLEQYYRSLCLATVRILLYLSQFPIREHLNRVVWNFKLFNSERAEKSAKTWQFHENRSEHIERFFQQLHESLEQSDGTTAAQSACHARDKNTTTQKPVRLVYKALAAVVQDFIWDAPEIMSPIRSMKRGRVVRTKAAVTSSSLKSKESDCDKNMVIILSSCPASDREVRKFCYGPSIIEEASEVPVAVATISEQLLPPALLTQLASKGIAVHWVHTGAPTEGRDSAKVPPGLSLMSDVLKKAGGSLIPLSTLVTPLAPQLKIHNSSMTPQLPPIPLTAVEIGSAKVSSSCGADSAVEVPSVSSVDSELMRPPSLPKVRPSTLLSRELLSSLVLPPPALLKDYLVRPRGHGECGRARRGGRERKGWDGPCGNDGGSDRPLATLKENNLLWFSTRDGNVLFIVELHPMCRLLTPNLSTTVTCQTAARQHSAEKGGRVRERERQSAAASRRILLRKKLSFSKALKNNSESLSAQEGTPETHTLEADSHSILENSIPIPSVVSTPSPSMVAVGLVRQSDLPLSWLDPTAVFSCNGLYVPRETRNTLRRSLSKGSEESSRANSFNLSSEEDIDSKGPDPRGITAASKKSLPCAASPSPRTPTYLGINISPVVRLNRCLLLIPGSSHGNQSASANRRRRTSSVPKDVLCSLSKDSVAGEENKENKSTADTERLTRIKSSHSLPSSPVVLCTKLPLLRCHDSSQPAPLSLALSPKLVQQKLRDAQESARTANETHKDNTCIHPEESLHQSGRYCSRQYQNLSLWLAKNSLLLVVKVEGSDGGSWLGVLQPVTSLVSTLSLLKPQHHSQLLNKLINPPSTSSSKESAKTTNSTSAKFVPVPLKSKRQLPPRRCRTASQVLRDVSQPSALQHESGVPSRVLSEKEKLGLSADGAREERKASSMEESEGCPWGSGIMAGCASDSELYAGLQLLFRQSKPDKSLCDDSVQSCLLSALAEAPPFTHLPLLPWFPFTQHCNINQQDIERLQELQLDIKDSEYGEVQRKSRLLAALKELYSCGQAAAAVSAAERESIEPPSCVQDKQLDQPTLDEVSADSSCSLPSVSSIEELCDWFHCKYEEQVKLCQDGDSLLRWSARTLATFQSSFTRLALPQELSAEEREARLWEQLHCKGVLLSNTQLGHKYERMAKDKMEGGEAATDTAGEEEGEREGEGCSLQERKITEHLLQILLHFEALKLCSSVELETKMATANTLVVLFRKLSLLANPGLVGSCLKKIVLPVYLSSCQDVLTEVYTQLMLPLPSDLSSSPDRPLSPPDPSTVEGEGEEGESSEDWTPLMSLEEPPAAPKLTELGVKRLARHTSFHDNQSHRQITVMNKKMKRKRKRQKPKQRAEASNPPRRSPRIAKLIDPQKGTGRSVCRSLFSRSMSVSCEVGTKRKREREEEEEEGEEREDTENQLAKRRKSIHSLQRHHTVVEGTGLFKSPRKSFYSGANVPRRVTTPLFKTPPLKENRGKIHRNSNLLSPRILLNKEPSPAAIYSLLHGNMVSPQDQQDDSSLARTPCKSTKDVAMVAAATALTVSPHVRGKLERTPESKGQSRDLSFTPLGHRGGSGLAPPRDLSLMLSPGVLASYLVTNTPSSMARSVERGGTQLTMSHCASTSCGATAAVGVRGSGFKSVRMLKYENEDPLLKKNIGQSKSNSMPGNLSPSKISSTSGDGQHLSTASELAIGAGKEERGSQRALAPLSTSLHPSRSVHDSTLSSDGDCNIFLVSPPSLAPPPSSSSAGVGGSGVCLLTDLDPSIENESASMIAFALSTPTKDEPRDFLDAFN